MHKNYKNDQGFAHLLFVFVIVALLVVGFTGWKVLSSNTKETNTQQQSTPSTSEPDIELENLGIQTLDQVLISQDAVREFKTNGLKGFYVFGEALSGGRLNPTFEFASLKSDTKVVSAINGIVAFIKEQPESKDFEVFIQPKNNSKWTVGYDHLTNVVVEKGATISAGDIIGEPALQNNGLTRFEIQVNKDEDGSTTHICPSTLLGKSVKEQVLAELTAMQNSWESITGLELYTPSNQDPAGCIVKTLTPSQAEGK